MYEEEEEEENLLQLDEESVEDMMDRKKIYISSLYI
jgi:hypothetical protein